MPFEGGLPIVKDSIVIGAIGVSGVTAEQDGIIARAGSDAL
jgi:glc operon protein GlcG